jgi:hypothetical protein
MRTRNSWRTVLTTTASKALERRPSQPDRVAVKSRDLRFLEPGKGNCTPAGQNSGHSSSAVTCLDVQSAAQQPQPFLHSGFGA